VAEIRRMRPAEAPVVRALYRAAIEEAARLHPENRIGISEQGLDNLETHFRLGAAHDDVLTLVAARGPELVGFVTAEVTRGRSLPGIGGEIHELWMRPDAAFREGERLLAQRAIAWLRERGARVITHSEEAVHPAREPWEGLGFKADVIRFSLYG
jgi:hypothetical protein